ncbi:hypothetical protein [Xylanibacillus composti]|uniref:Terpene synthase n=1 Tax=Xylanibacillus composti TaxID=1572762 RepID=A0A8J4H3B9_9BACL|nr:hypothetical protein [Xylanibacillus composti]GIQ70217.1 hypothetical protein XYCOK13_30410 [Xylanibacillus composti]
MQQHQIWLDPYMEELAGIFTALEKAIAEFPSPLNEIGWQYAKQFHPLVPNSKKNYICYLLPFWLQSWSGISTSECRRLALADVWVMLHFFLLDDNMDENPADKKARLALANLFALAYMQEYRQLFHSESTFWSKMEEYVANWAEAVAQEDDADFFVSAPLKTAWKAAPVKLAAAGAFLLGQREEQLACAEQAIDLVLVTLQMSDDWLDWQEDLATGSYNGLLSLVRHRLGWPPEEVLSESTCRAALYDLKLYEEFADKTNEQEKQLQMLQPESPELIAFHQYLLEGFSSSSSTISEEVRLLSLGGFYHWLSNYRNY